jgi:hypothetical protein
VLAPNRPGVMPGMSQQYSRDDAAAPPCQREMLRAERPEVGTVMAPASRAVLMLPPGHLRADPGPVLALAAQLLAELRAALTAGPRLWGSIRIRALGR